jgi:hypothetical protein
MGKLANEVGIITDVVGCSIEKPSVLGDPFLLGDRKNPGISA